MLAALHLSTLSSTSLVFQDSLFYTDEPIPISSLLSIVPLVLIDGLALAMTHSFLHLYYQHKIALGYRHGTMNCLTI